jgi:hypothetical protein
MPFVSLKQNAWAHTPAGVRALGGPAKVKEWEGATNYSDLPEKKEPPRETMLGGAVRRAKVKHG